MELNQLRCFRLAAELENLSRTAKFLQISQPSVSQTIRRLEQEMGYPLFRRDGKRIELNRSGEILLDAVIRMEQILEEAKQAIREENRTGHPDEYNEKKQKDSVKNKKEDTSMLQMSMVFGDGMVLQRQKEIAVWGSVTAGAAVKVTLAGGEGSAYGSQTVETTSVEDGSWKVTLPAGEAERGLCMTVVAGEEMMTFTDVCIGEVWIAGGQSNMEYLMKYDADRVAEFAKEANPNLRFFDYPEVSYETQWEEFPDADYGFWRKADAENLPWFSAVGYYFGAQLQQKLDIPVGIVGCNWGGTPSCAWQDPEGLRGTAGEVWLTDYEEAVKDLDIPAYEQQVRAGLERDRNIKLENSSMAQGRDRILFPGFTHEEQIKMMEMMEGGGEFQMPPMGPMHPYRPGGLYETMLKKVAPYTAKGVIWYQGESDDAHGELYAEVFGSMIQCWRKLWQDELPFLFVQLAPYGEWLGMPGTGYPVLREQQELLAKTMPQTWMASITDAGMQYDIHPKHKKPVGLRLAELALGHVYEKPELCQVPGLCDAPEFAGAERISGEEDVICLRFRHGDGLHLEQHNYTTIEPEEAWSEVDEMTWTEGSVELDQAEIGALKLFSAATGEELTGWTASLDQEENLVFITGDLPEKVEVRFAWEAYYEVNLYNEAGIPVKPFRVTV